MKIRLEPYLASEEPHNSPTTATHVVAPLSVDHLRRPPMLIFDPGATGLGRHVQSARSIKRATLLCHSVRDARHTGLRLVADPSGWIALDEVLTSASACQALLGRLSSRDNVGWREDTDVEVLDDGFGSARLDSEDFYVSGTTFSLLSQEPANYGSWLFRILPKLALARSLGLTGYNVVCWAPRPFQRQLLEFFGVTETEIVDIWVSKSYRYEQLIVPTCPNPEAFLNESTLAFVSDMLERNGIRRRREKCIYISRVKHAQKKGLANVRHFVNEESLVNGLAHAGFEIVEPESLTVLEQIELFASAGMVVGASGAAMFNTMFCAPGTVVFDIEAFPYWLHAHANYFSSLGHNYIMAFGTADATDSSGPHQRWTIDVPKAIEQILRVRDLVAINSSSRAS